MNVNIGEFLEVRQGEKTADGENVRVSNLLTIVGSNISSVLTFIKIYTFLYFCNMKA